MSDIISLNKVTVSLDNKTILNDISFGLPAGEILGLLGPSGCGKTTLLNTIAGFIKPVSGEMLFVGNNLVAAGKFVEPEQRHIGVIFQDYALFPHLTVAENIAFGIQKLDKNEKNKRIEYLMMLLKITPQADSYPHQLSGGQQQRVAIARALAPQPQLLLLDEPFSNIDARLRNELMIELRSLLKRLEISAIFVTHNKDEVFTFADKVAVLAQGSILQFGDPVSVCKQPKSWQVADFLQLGSWLPVQLKEKQSQESQQELQLSSLLGDFAYSGSDKFGNEKALLLLKPQYVQLQQGEAANCVIEHISVTEQGYHYLAASIDQNNALTFQQLSFYHSEHLSLGQEISLTVTPHEYLIFNDN